MNKSRAVGFKSRRRYPYVGVVIKKEKYMIQLNVIALLLLFIISVRAGERPWQEIVIPAKAEVEASFKSPPTEYGMILWWGWDGPVDTATIIRDLDYIKSRGFNCIMIEAGYGMSEEYLTPGWFELVRFAVEQARLRGMRVWIEDEGKYPSGFAGGKFSKERPDLRMQGLVVADRIEIEDGETISRQLSPDIISAAAFNTDDKSSRIIDIQSGNLNWTAPEGSWEIILVQHKFRTSLTRAAGNPTRGKDTTNSLCDYLNPEATRQFLAWTHEEYKKVIGHEFGKTFLGFMGDEPDFAYTPWTPKMPEEFKKRKGYDVRPFIALFFTPKLSDEAQRAKADYWDVWTDLFSDNFFRVQAEWCAQNNIEYIVHLNHEDDSRRLVKSTGDFFKQMRHVAVPGVDAIWKQIWMDQVADYPKLGSSAAHLFGRPRAFTESFAAYTIKPNVPQAKWVIDYQLVRGINMVQIMIYLSSVSHLAPLAKQDPPAFFQSDEFIPVAAYINRATYLLSLGRPAAQIALYYPTSSIWLADSATNKSTLAIAQSLLEQQLDFDFIDEQALKSLLEINGSGLKNLSGQQYRAVIIPAVTVISKRALDRLQIYSKNGGCVIFIGSEPSLVVERTFLNASGPADISWALHQPSGELTSQVIELLPRPDVKLDRTAPYIKYVHRRWRDADLYFFFNESEQQISCSALLAGEGKVQVWDAFTGKVTPLADVISKQGRMLVPLELNPWKTKFIVIGR